jgi:hypothetical protein
MSDARTDWDKNGMSEAEWNALSEAARDWRRRHPSHADHEGARTGVAGAAAGGAPAPGAAPAGSSPAGSGQAARAAAGADLSPHGATPPVDAENPPPPPPMVSGGTVILTGDAKAAARGDLHGTIEHNTRARDQAMLAGHVDPDTSPVAVAEALASSSGGDPDEMAKLVRERLGTRPARSPAEQEAIERQRTEGSQGARTTPEGSGG